MTQNEYSTLIYFWFGHPQPERIEDMLATLERAEWAQVPALGLPIAGTVKALEQSYPDRAHAWRAAHPDLYRRINDAAITGQDCPEWADYHIARWFILRQETEIDAVLDRVADGGPAGFAVEAKLVYMAEQSPVFRKVLLKAREARRMAMLIR